MKQKQPVGRPIGQQIRDICCWLEQHGPATCGEIQRGTGIKPQSVPATCMRAVCFGLVGCTGKTKKTYWAIAGWAEQIQSRDRPKLRDRPVEAVFVTPKINSVWALGA